MRWFCTLLPACYNLFGHPVGMYCNQGARYQLERQGRISFVGPRSFAGAQDDKRRMLIRLSVYADERLPYPSPQDCYLA
jgi:hypothetical protein